MFAAAVALASPAEREAYLNEACAGDAATRGRVEALLHAHDRAGHVLDRPVAFNAEGTVDLPAQADPERTLDHAPAGEQPGAVIAGRYVLMEQIGEGGMGWVWAARQTEPVKRKVALKLIKAGMDSRAVLARFESERQALALMDHPNIAKVFDGGLTGDRRPFFVMELVNGLPLTRFCDEARLTPRQRLELFVPVCHAVQHAHQKGIVHRDLKPSNILVTLYDGRPVPKVIDFGVAKATGGQLSDETAATQFGAVIGTPEYMAPEQAGFSALDIDTRADIYSLGVILYELLTGLRPFDAKRLRRAALDEVIRIIREEEPSRPSMRLSTDESLPSLAAVRQTEPKKLTALMRGELDWVVMKCLEKGRERRYETASGLARDIERFLADEPVEARPPSSGYRLRKFARRNRGPLAAAAIVFLALFAGIVGTSLGLVRAVDEGKRADAARITAEANETRAKESEATVSAKAIEANAAKDNYRHMLYAANLGRAQDALRQHRVTRLDELLEEMKPASGESDLRGFEWHYLSNLIHGVVRESILHPDPGPVGPGACACLSSDGRWAAALKDSNASNEPGFTPTLSGYRADTLLRVWDTATGQVVFQKEERRAVNWRELSLSDDGHCIAWGSEKTVTVYDSATGAVRSTISLEHPLQGIEVDARGQRLLTLTAPFPHGKSVTQVWDLNTSKVLFKVPRSEKELWIQNIVLSPNGKYLAFATHERISPPGTPPPDIDVTVWDVTTGERRCTLPRRVHDLPDRCFSPDSGTLATTHDRTVTLWDAATGQEKQRLPDLADTVKAVAFTPNGQLLAAGDTSGTVTVFDLTLPELVPLASLVGHARPVKLLGFRSDDGPLVSVCEMGRLLVRDCRHLTWRGETNPSPSSLRAGPCSASADLRWALTAPTGRSVQNAEIVLWDTAEGRACFRRNLVPAEYPNYAVWMNGPHQAVLSPDGRRVAVSWISHPLGFTPARVQARDLGTGFPWPTPIEGFGGLVRAAQAWQFLTPRPERTVVWDVASGRELLTLPEFSHAMIFSPNGRFVAVATAPRSSQDDASAPAWQVWDLEDGTVRVKAPNAPAMAWVISPHAGVFRFTPDSRALVVLEHTGVKTDRGGVRWQPARLHRWDLATGRSVFAREVPNELVECNRHSEMVVCSPDGSRLAGAVGAQVERPGGLPAEIRIWDVAPDGELLLRRRLDYEWLVMRRSEGGGAYGMVFSPDGNRLVAMAHAGTQVWDLTDDSRPPLFLRDAMRFPGPTFSPDGSRLASRVSGPREGAGEALKLWDLARGQELLAVPLPPLQQGNQPIGTTFDDRQIRILDQDAKGWFIRILDGTPQPQTKTP
jgi:serine/threonine protein kinase/WD40 repeat protein